MSVPVVENSWTLTTPIKGIVQGMNVKLKGERKKTRLIRSVS